MCQQVKDLITENVLLHERLKKRLVDDLLCDDVTNVTTYNLIQPQKVSVYIVLIFICKRSEECNAHSVFFSDVKRLLEVIENIQLP